MSQPAPPKRITPIAARLTGSFVAIAILSGLLLWWQWNTSLHGTSDTITTGIMIFLSFLLVVFVVFGIITAQSLTRRLKKLNDGAQSIASGNLSTVIQDTGHDEVNRLSHTFNELADRTRDTYQRLALEKQQAQTLLQSMGEGLVAVDKQGNIILINTNATALFGITDRDVTIGRPIVDIIKLWAQKRPVSKAHHPALVALKRGHSSSDIYELPKENTKPQLLNISTSPVILDDDIAGAILLIRDVTKEREVDRMKTEFISLASHQLRTPLSAIKWFSEMLISGDAGKMNAEQTEFARNISDSTERMIELVNSLLNISRIESGRIIIDPKPTDLKMLVDGIVSDLSAKTEERQQNLIVSVHADLPKINIDPRLIGQVYLNLLTNAIKYTPKKGDISVFISKKGREVVSQVSDTGYGIPIEEQSKMFQKFFRAANVAKVETDGTGLGMYLVKAIIESSGGKIWFKSEEGKGSTFWFSLPLSGMKAKEGEVTLDN